MPPLAYSCRMDAGLVEEVIATNQPFRIKTAGGDTYEVPHRDFVSFSARRTTLIVSFESGGKERIAYIPLLTVTSIEAQPETSGAK